jgi:hypothetical protein
MFYLPAAAQANLIIRRQPRCTPSETLLIGHLEEERERVALDDTDTQVLPFPVRFQLREMIFWNEPEGIAAEEQPKQWISKTGDGYLSGIRALTKTSSGLD